MLQHSHYLGFDHIPCPIETIRALLCGFSKVDNRHEEVLVAW
jgi:hypothetical protein